MAAQPVQAPPDAASANHASEEFGREPEPDLRLAGRLPRHACRMLRLEVVEPLAEIGQPVGVWSSQKPSPKVRKTAQTGLRRDRRRADHMGGSFGCQERQTATNI